MDRRIEELISDLHADPYRRRTTAEMAEILNLSPSHLRELFKGATGKSLMRYLRDLRMQRAKELLDTSHLRIKEIVTEVGMNNVVPFLRAFKRAYGLTPTQYRSRSPIAKTPKTKPARRGSQKS